MAPKVYPKPGEMYTHYKSTHMRYRIIGIGTHSETREKLVIYEMLYDTPDFPKGSIWLRPLDMFMEEVEVNGTQQQRFTKQDDVSK